MPMHWIHLTAFLGQRKRKAARGHCLILHTCRRWLLFCSTLFSLESKEEEIHPVSTGNRRSSFLPQLNIERRETMARRNSNLDNLLSSSVVNQSVDGCTLLFLFRRWEISPAKEEWPWKTTLSFLLPVIKWSNYVLDSGDRPICWESLWLVHHRKSRHMSSVHQSWWLNCRVQ